MTEKAAEANLAQMTARFLDLASRKAPSPDPRWLQTVERALSLDRPPSIRELANGLDLHPGWLAQAYRAAKGEGLHETMRRKRTEVAIALLRGSNCSLADAALQSGFCDQSHMNRVFRASLGRTPAQVRSGIGKI